MRKFQRRRPLRLLLYSWPAFFVIAILAGFVGRAAWIAYGNARVARESYSAARASREETESRENDLRQKLNELSSPYGIEKELRARYSLRKPGEAVVIFVRPEEKAAAPVVHDSSFFAVWRDWIRAFLPSL